MQAPMVMAPLECFLQVKPELKGWHKMCSKIVEDISGVSFCIKRLLVDPNSWMYIDLMHITGKVDPIVFIKKLYKARTYAMLKRIEYGNEENPEETRKPNDHFMTCNFEINILDESWYKKVLVALKTIQGVSLIIDGQQNSGYLRGNIESARLMKMMAKAGIESWAMNYGVMYKNATLKTLKPSAKGTEQAEPAKDKEPPPLENVSTSKHYQVVYKKPRGFKRFFC
ncbi:unnamed protein product [Microthlaspi erraticum]|uniref:Uncharacterized protein n=1 Tax=Microthlaspi erraticum TaxID=1685480 RepID=A0A6D2KCE1_9BRAS|nr:unnamed protein product [Microthlaspi erraticum]